MGFIGFNFNLLDQLSFYGFYHQKHGNQIIHFFFVPAILWSVDVWLAYTGALWGVDLPAHLSFLPPWLAGAAVFNWTLVNNFIVLGLYFTTLEPFAGLSWTACIGLPLWLSATLFWQHVAHAWAWAIPVHIAGWLMQVVVGHIMIEHRKPALLDSLFQSLILASLFAWMEGLFRLGYRPKLQEQLRKRIAERGQQAASDSTSPLLAQSDRQPAASMTKKGLSGSSSSAQ
ncbi:hypothetical protein WJX73_002373 [Symbiochloris irregularis]|uniref:DUF962 domain-containing protein n=1 Tax=Symbiochloris irregularis TaxID=706552 RepID=A0AAW1PGR2_9CHLO